MNRPYSRELSADTSTILIPLITLVAFVISIFYIAFNSEFVQSWPYWLIALIYPLTSYYAWHLVRKDQIERANLLFIVSSLIFLLLLISDKWVMGSPLPYVFGVFIIISSMTIHPNVSLLVWGVSAGLLVLVVSLANPTISRESLFSLITPILVNFFLAIAAYLSAYEWRFAVESINELHRKVRIRRNELFTIQEELQYKNAILQSLNQEIEKARSAAIEERDIRTRFMNMVSHELRTPLNSIVNFAHILSHGARGPVNEEQVDYLTRIQHSGWHLLGMLNDLLDMAQIQAGEFDLQLELTDLHEVCEAAIKHTSGLQFENKLAIQTNYPKMWPPVMADPMRLQQAIINLLGNAYKYTSEGYICLHVRVVEPWVHIGVEDSGIGIPPEHLERIFEEFHQINQSVARRRVGTGLGLPITKHLIEQHGGRISVKSQLGKGSFFTLSIPIWNPNKNETIEKLR